MAYNIRILKQAQKYIWEATDWYNEQSPGLGHELLQEFFDHLPKLRKNPGLYSPLFGRFRKLRLNRFPYYIVYSIDEKRKQVAIFVFWHVKRNPESLRKILGR